MSQSTCTVQSWKFLAVLPGLSRPGLGELSQSTCTVQSWKFLAVLPGLSRPGLVELSQSTCTVQLGIGSKSGH
jgi:hypothetical protein